LLDALKRTSEDLFIDALTQLASILPLNHKVYYAQMFGTSDGNSSVWEALFSATKDIDPRIAVSITEALYDDDTLQEIVNLASASLSPKQRIMLAVQYYKIRLNETSLTKLTAIASELDSKDFE
jgi:hypothetical protein